MYTDIPLFYIKTCMSWTFLLVVSPGSIPYGFQGVSAFSAHFSDSCNFGTRAISQVSSGKQRHQSGPKAQGTQTAVGAIIPGYVSQRKAESGERPKIKPLGGCFTGDVTSGRLCFCLEIPARMTRMGLATIFSVFN